jgi:hypothetical protein
MRVFIIAVISCFAAIGLEPSVAQTSAPTLPSVAVTSPLNQSVTNVTGLQSNPDNVGTANSAPCSSAYPGMSALPTFDGGGLDLGSTGGMSRSCGTAASAGPEMITSPTPNTSAPTSASSAGSTSAVAAPAASSLGTSAGGTPGGGLAGLGTGGLGTGGLGAVGLGAASLGSQSSSQTPSASTGVAGSSTFCSAGSGASSSTNTSITNTSAGGAGNLGGMTIDIPQGTDASGLVRNPASGVVSGPYDPAESLAGEARVPTMNAAGAPCLIGE